MKNIYSFIIISTLLISCSTAPLDQIIQTAIAGTQSAQPTNTLPPEPTTTQTPEPTSTSVVLSIATQTPLRIDTPTEDLSFYDLADCLPKNTLYQKAIVTQVIDGDTIYVRLDDGNTYSVRYIGIDAPERERPFFTESYNANSDMVGGKEVILIRDVSETDQYDRLLMYVIVDNIFVNLELIRTGFATAMSYPPDVACADIFLSAEYQTRASEIGIWLETQTPESSTAQVIIVAVNKKDEYVEIENVGTTDVDLTGWTLISERGHQDCPLLGIIKAGETMRIWSMISQGGGYSCGYGSPIWNNSEPDPAVLYNAQGVEVSRK
jgi:endonuclease YncB( thermonuclease family)